MPDEHTPEPKEGAEPIAEAPAHGDSHAVADAHGHDDSHDDGHAVPADLIPENSVHDKLLSGLALAVGAALVGLIIYWCGLKPAEVHEGEAGEHHEVQQEAPANTEPAPIH